MGRLAAELGVTIRIARLERRISGQISREDEKYIIRVNRYEVRERQRFTIAHELAHYLLHRHVIDASPRGIRDNVLYRSGAPRIVEYQANRLAAEIIMPRELLIRKLGSNGQRVDEKKTERLAAEFQVSPLAMKMRLETILGI